MHKQREYFLSRYLGFKIVKTDFQNLWVFFLYFDCKFQFERSIYKYWLALADSMPGGTFLVYFVFQTTFGHRGGYSPTTTRTNTLFLFHHVNKIELIVSSVEERSTCRSICDVILQQICWESYSSWHPRDFRNADDWFFFFFKGIGFILLI